MPNILLFDIECLPNLAFIWDPRIYSGYISPQMIVQERVISCIAWKWLGKKKIYTSKFDISTKNDKECVREFLNAWRSAHAVITANGDEFDIKWVRNRAAFWNLSVMKPVIQIDTKKMSKKAFNLNSHGLEYKGKYFGIGEKIKVEFELWKRIFFGSKKALREQVQYCKQDVKLLEGEFLHHYRWEPNLRPKVRDLYLAAGLL